MLDSLIEMFSIYLLGVFFCVVGAYINHEGLYILGEVTLVWGIIVQAIGNKYINRRI